MDKFRIMVKQITGQGLDYRTNIINEPNSYLPAKKTLDLIDLALRDRSVKKIVIHKLSDYKEGDIF